MTEAQLQGILGLLCDATEEQLDCILHAISRQYTQHHPDREMTVLYLPTSDRRYRDIALNRAFSLLRRNALESWEKKD